MKESSWEHSSHRRKQTNQSTRHKGKAIQQGRLNSYPAEHEAKVCTYSSSERIRSSSNPMRHHQSVCKYVHTKGPSINNPGLSSSPNPSHSPERQSSPASPPNHPKPTKTNECMAHITINPGKPAQSHHPHPFFYPNLNPFNSTLKAQY